jgi:hypothetical protein
MDGLRIELRRSVEQLKPVQAYSVVFFQEHGFVSPHPNGLVMANGENKRRAMAFIETVKAVGKSDPIPALEFAFRAKPELIYLVTDGDFGGPGNAAVVELCKRESTRQNTRVSTLALIHDREGPEPAEREFVRALERIAADSGGTMKVVYPEDLGR